MYKFKSEFLKNISVLAGGTAVAQTITFVATLYLTKLYLPESLGLLSLATSIVSMLLPLATLRYDKAIVIAEDEKESYSLILLSILSSTALFLVISLIGLGLYMFNLIDKSKTPLLLIIPSSVFFYGLINIFQMYFERNSKFGVTSKAAIIDAVSKSGFQFILFKYFPFVGMLLGYFLTLIVNTTFYLSNTKGFIKKCLEYYNKSSLISTAIKYNKFPKYFTWSNMLDSTAQNICSILFPIFFSLSILGSFSIAFKIVRLPALLISMAVRRSYYPKASSYILEKKPLFKFYLKSSKILILISVIPVILFQLFADELFQLFFDESWWSAASYAKIILIYVFINFINSLAHENMIIFGLQKTFLIIEIIWILLSISLIYWAYIINNSFLAVIFYSLSGVIMELLVFVIQFNKLKKNHVSLV